MSDDEILSHWALRIDREKIDWDGSEILTRFRKELVPPSEIVQILAVFYDLQRWLFKAGGSQLPTHHPDWYAIRTLFLLTAKADVPVEIRHRERWSEWEDYVRDKAEAQIATVARIHSRTPYWMDFGTLNQNEEPSASVALRLYDAEQYLIDDVGWRFKLLSRLTAFEFFSIVIWKANRAKSKIAKKLLRIGTGKGLADLDAAVGELTGQIASAIDEKSRLEVLMVNWEFALPMASAILAILYPDEFTVYDVRACENLANPAFDKLGNLKWSDKLWNGYRDFRDTVARLHPDFSLRDNDRVLWSTSAVQQLQSDLQSGFAIPKSEHDSGD